MKTRLILAGYAVSASVAALSMLVVNGAAFAQKGEPAPKPKIDCSKPANQKLAACKNRNRELSDDELFYAGYWLARKGDHALALHYLNQAENKSDPRILTYIGYSTRKLGRTDEAMGYYARALEMKPGYAVARAYLGEAYLEQGQPAKAAEQLALIELQAGRNCIEYKELAAAMAKAQS